MSEETMELRNNPFIAALAGNKPITEKRSKFDGSTGDALTLESFMALVYDIQDNNFILEETPEGLDKVTISGDFEKDHIIKSNFSKNDTAGERQKVIQGLITRASELKDNGKLHFFILDGGTSSNPDPNTTHTSLVASCGDHIYFLDPDGATYGRFPTEDMSGLNIDGINIHTNLLVLQEDKHSCRNYVLEMMCILKDEFRDLGKDGFNDYMQNYFYDGIIDNNISTRETIDTNEKSSIIPPEFVELAQGGNISFLKERVETCKSKAERYKKQKEEELRTTEVLIITALAVAEKESKETKTSQESLEKFQERLKSLEEQKSKLGKTLITLQSRESRLNEIESTLEAVTQQKLENIKYGIDDFIKNRLNRTVDSNEGIRRKEAVKQTIGGKLSELKNELEKNSSEDPTEICNNFLSKTHKDMSKQRQTFGILENIINDIKYGDKVRCIVNKRHLSHLEKLVEQEKKNMVEKDKDIGGIPPK